jgi:hypothetical protein
MTVAYGRVSPWATARVLIQLAWARTFSVTLVAGVSAAANPSVREMLWATWLTSLVFVFPIPGTIVLCNLALLVGVIALIWTGRQNLPKAISELKLAGWALVALTAWYEVRIACTKSRARRWALRCELETRLK